MIFLEKCKIFFGVIFVVIPFVALGIIGKLWHDFWKWRHCVRLKQESQGEMTEPFDSRRVPPVM